MYKFHKKIKRVDWFYENYAKTDDFSIDEFLRRVNESYYYNSAKLYSSRFIDDIQDAYSSMREELKIEDTKNKYNVINIGAGTGFDYNIFKNLNIQYDSYFFIEPSKDMIKEFLSRHNDNDDKKIVIKNNHFHEVLNDLRNKDNKFIFINSVLHHVIYIEKFLDDIKSIMNPDDILVIGHEPNNSYNPLMFFLNLTFRAIFTSALIKKVPFLKIFYDNEVKSNERWEKINTQLLDEGVIIKKMSPLTIRRIIDYGVGHKKDWKRLNIPKDYNEGFIDVHDISKYLGNEYKRKFYITYRHFGDSNGNVVIESLNNTFKSILKNHGTNFLSVWKKS